MTKCFIFSILFEDMEAQRLASRSELSPLRSRCLSSYLQVFNKDEVSNKVVSDRIDHYRDVACMKIRNPAYFGYGNNYQNKGGGNTEHW